MAGEIYMILNCVCVDLLIDDIYSLLMLFEFCFWLWLMVLGLGWLATWSACG